MPHHNTHGSRWATITEGMEVYSADDKKVGEVIDVATEYIRVGKSSLFTTDLYIPRVSIAGVDGRRVWLHLTSDEIARRPWAQTPRQPASTGATGAFGPGERAFELTGRVMVRREGEPPHPYREEEPMIGTYPKIEEIEADEQGLQDYGRYDGDRDW